MWSQHTNCALLRNAKRRPMWTPLDYAGLPVIETTAQPMGLLRFRLRPSASAQLFHGGLGEFRFVVQVIGVTPNIVRMV